ncbi:MAG: DUF177 domain-containing protein [Rhizobiaceae bacterium]|nr:MAG: DUF177 domain-containing protein [Rhizobiaceae bacterium]
MTSGTSPVSFRASVLHLPQKGMPVTIEADETQRHLLAQVHGLLSVGSFRADIVVSNWKSDGVRVNGQVVADITQACVISLDPVESHVEAQISALFVPENSRLAKVHTGNSEEIVLDADGPDSPEPFSGEKIDVGALAEEYFALAIDPYPRKDGVHLEEIEAFRPDAAEAGPLAGKLAALKLKR